MKALVDFENSFDQVTNINEKEMMLEFNEMIERGKEEQMML